MPDNRKPLKYGAFPVCRNYTVRAMMQKIKMLPSASWALSSRTAKKFPSRIPSSPPFLKKTVPVSALAPGTTARAPARSPERSGHQDGQRHAGSLLCRVHFGYLCPCHYNGTEGSRTNHGQYPEYVNSALQPIEKP